MGLTGSIFVSIVTGILVVELYVWEPFVSRGLLKLAIRKAPFEEQDRLREEWQAHWNELPGGAARLVSSIGFVWSAWTLERDSQESAKRFLIFLTELLIVAEGFRWALFRRPSAAKIFAVRQFQGLIRSMDNRTEWSAEAVNDLWSLANEWAWNRLSARLRRRIIADIEGRSQQD
jgi:hypothetical protein